MGQVARHHPGRRNPGLPLACGSHGPRCPSPRISPPPRAQGCGPTVCASISASLRGLLPPAATTVRRRCRLRMKSDADTTPTTQPSRPSHTGALAQPCLPAGVGSETRGGSGDQGRRPPATWTEPNAHDRARASEAPTPPLPSPLPDLLVQGVEGLPQRQVAVQHHAAPALGDELVRAVGVQEVGHLLARQVLWEGSRRRGRGGRGLAAGEIPGRTSA